MSLKTERRVPRTGERVALNAAQRAEIARIDAGGDATDGAQVVASTVRRPLMIVVPVRFSRPEWTILEREAALAGIQATALIEDWLEARLRDAAVRQGVAALPVATRAGAQDSRSDQSGSELDIVPV
jgi:hypothetical protein